MANQIFCPETGDKVLLSDGRTGLVVDIDDREPVYLGGGRWMIVVEADKEADGWEEDELVEDVEVDYDEETKTWKE